MSERSKGLRRPWIRRHTGWWPRRHPQPSAGWRAGTVTLAAAMVATLGVSTALHAWATRAGGAHPVRTASGHPGRRQDAASATTLQEPLLPPRQPRDTVKVAGETLPPVYFRVPTTKPVVFLTIDDGWVPSLPALKLIRARHLPVTAFLIHQAWRRHPAYFRALRSAGVAIEDHTLTHPVMSRLPLAQQELEICGAAAAQAAGLGARPTLFRPPYGVFNRATLRATQACHLTAVVEWTATVDHGHLVVVGGRLRPGDIILMHFRSSLPRDLTAALEAIRRVHLTLGRLASYLEAPTAPHGRPHEPLAVS